MGKIRSKVDQTKSEWAASKRELQELDRLQREYNANGGKGRRP